MFPRDVAHILNNEISTFKAGIFKFLLVVLLDNFSPLVNFLILRKFCLYLKRRQFMDISGQNCSLIFVKLYFG